MQRVTSCALDLWLALWDSWVRAATSSIRIRASKQAHHTNAPCHDNGLVQRAQQLPAAHHQALHTLRTRDPARIELLCQY